MLYFTFYDSNGNQQVYTPLGLYNTLGNLTWNNLINSTNGKNDLLSWSNIPELDDYLFTSFYFLPIFNSTHIRNMSYLTILYNDVVSPNFTTMTYYPPTYSITIPFNISQKGKQKLIFRSLLYTNCNKDFRLSFSSYNCTCCNVNISFIIHVFYNS